jgi:arsenical pump membrane protein
VIVHVVLAVVLLAATLAAAVARPGGLPEAVVAVPAALIAVGAGLIGVDAALAEIGELGPTVGFLAAVLALGHLADLDGAFSWLGQRLRRAATGRPRRLFGLVMVAAAVTTAALSLDATVVLLTPVVLVTARRGGLPGRPHLYACGHLANSASTLLPVSNLTNLLAFATSGLTFLGFTALMALPWVIAIVVEYAVLGWWFRADFRPVDAPPTDGTDDSAAPLFALVTLGLTLVGFGAASLVGIEPVWPAALGTAVLGVRALARHTITPLRLVRAASPQFCLFVLGIGVVVAALGATGLTAALAAVVPTAPTLVGLLAMAGIAAVLANLVNNLPAALLLIGVLGQGAPPALVLAMLLGVNIGPNLTYAGSLATLLWRRVLRSADERVRLGEFTAVGALTVPIALSASVLALWLVS